MKKYTYELLAKSKTTDNVICLLVNDKKEAEAKAKGAAAKGFSVLVIGHKDGHRVGVTLGPKVDWTKYQKTVQVTFGGRETFTYKTSVHWEVGDAMHLNTPHGIRYAVVASDTRYTHIKEICDLEDAIGYSLKSIEEVICE